MSCNNMIHWSPALFFTQLEGENEDVEEIHMLFKRPCPRVTLIIFIIISLTKLVPCLCLEMREEGW